MNIWYFATVWPQLTKSAASVRTFGILKALLSKDARINFISSSSKNKEHLSELKQQKQIGMHSCNPNHEKQTLECFKSIENKPDVAIFDTFVAEEMFSSYIYNQFPECLRIIDNQDYHSLRVKRQDMLHTQLKDEKYNLKDIIKAFPNLTENEYYSRELASYYRSDLVLTCSDYEQFKLCHEFNLRNTGLITFFYDEKEDIISDQGRSFEHRENFVWIGNFNHPPNLDGVYYLINEIWPKISSKLPKVELHIYGANFPKDISEINHPTIKPKGLMKDLSSLKKYRVLLAPIRYGAGVKGKITDSWCHGLPVVTTPIGSEGLYLESINYHFDPIVANQNQMSSPVYDNDGNMLAELYKYNSLQHDSMLNKHRDNDSTNSDKNINSSNSSTNSKSLGINFGGLAMNFDTEDLVASAIELYTNKKEWENCVDIGLATIKKRMSFKTNAQFLTQLISHSHKLLNESRKKNYIQALIWSETLRSHEKMLKYMIEKNKNKSGLNRPS